MRHLTLALCLLLPLACKSTKRSSQLQDISPTPSPDARTIDLSRVENRDEMKAVLASVINSVSLGQRVQALRPVDAQQHVYRFLLSDFGWDESSWNQLVSTYPYGNTRPVLSVRGDWLLARLLEPSQYTMLLGLPNSRSELEDQLGINVAEAIANESVLRSGFRTSGEVRFHRLLERLDLPGNQGAFWMSYDVDRSDGGRDLFAHPLDMESDRHRLLFNLPNGLLAYSSFDAQGRAIETRAATCMSCHLDQGILPHRDEVREFVLRNGSPGNEIDKILALYPSRDSLAAAIQDDQQRYQAIFDSVLTRPRAGSLQTLLDRYLAPLGLREAAAGLGIGAEQLREALDRMPQFPAVWQPLRDPSGRLSRADYERTFGLVMELINSNP